MNGNYENDKYEMSVNSVRTILLRISDEEMTKKIKNPTTKINTNLPKMVNYCKENDFCIVLSEKFCSTRVSYNEESMKNIIVKTNYPRHHKKRSTFGNFSSKYITRIPSVAPSLKDTFNSFSVANFNLRMRTKANGVTNKTGIQRLSTIASANRNNCILAGVKSKAYIEENGILPLPDTPPESPSIRKLKNMRKVKISKPTKTYNDFEKEILTKRNKCGAYLEDPEVFLRIKESFMYIRSLPFLKKSSNAPRSPEIKKMEERKLKEEFNVIEESLILKDNIDEKIASKKINIIKKKSEDLRRKKRLNSIKLKCNKNLSPINKHLNKRNSKGSNLFLIDLRSAHDKNFKLDLEHIETSSPKIYTDKVNNNFNNDFELHFSSLNSENSDDEFRNINEIHEDNEGNIDGKSFAAKSIKTRVSKKSTSNLENQECIDLYNMENLQEDEIDFEGSFLLKSTLPATREMITFEENCNDLNKTIC